MDVKNKLSLNGLTTPHLLYIIISLAMVGVSVFLTSHFYSLHFPSGLDSATSLCQAGGFWGCDKAALSAAGSIFNVPTSFFGIIIGVMGLIGAIFPSAELEKTNKFFITLNFIGVILLFIYSLAALGGLCKFCTIYYVLSAIAFYLFRKKSDLRPVPEAKPLLLYIAMFVVPAFFMYNFYVDKLSAQNSLSGQYVNQFFKLAVPGDPSNDSEFRIYSSTEKFSDAPIRISVFSDFECPYCQKVSDQMPALIKTYKGKINIQYLFYPLDQSCNPNIKSRFHQNACRAAALSICDPKRFSEIHDYIFERQSELSYDNLNSWEKDLGLKGCFDKKGTQDIIMGTINSAEQYKLKSTPTIIINGRKLEGMIPTVYVKAILDELIKRESK